nr:hypothetical protein [Tanacetum cinerariifolium]
MTHLVTSLTPDSARSCVMQGAFLPQRKVSNVPFVFSLGGSISHEGFLPSILLFVIVVVAIIEVVVIVVISAIIKLSFVIIGSLHRIVLCYLFYYPLGYGNGFFHFLDLSLGTILIYQELFEFRPDDLIVFFYSNRIQQKILEFKTFRDRHGDNEMSDPIGGLVFLGTGSLPSGRGIIHNELSNSVKIDSSKGDPAKGKEVAIVKEQMNELITYQKEGGSIPKMPKLKSFITSEGALSQKEFNNQIKELKRIILVTFGITSEEKKRKRTQFLKEAFVTKDIRVDGMNKNLIPPPRVMPIEGLVIKEPEVDNKIKRIVASSDLHGCFLIRIDNIADLYD